MSSSESTQTVIPENYSNVIPENHTTVIPNLIGDPLFSSFFMSSFVILSLTENPQSLSSSNSIIRGSSNCHPRNLLSRIQVTVIIESTHTVILEIFYKGSIVIVIPKNYSNVIPENHTIVIPNLIGDPVFSFFFFVILIFCNSWNQVLRKKERLPGFPLSREWQRSARNYRRGFRNEHRMTRNRLREWRRGDAGWQKSFHHQNQLLRKPDNF